MTFRPDHKLRVRVFSESDDPPLASIPPYAATGILVFMTGIFFAALATLVCAFFLSPDAALRPVMAVAAGYAVLAGIEWHVGMRGHARNDLLTAVVCVIAVTLMTRTLH